MFSDPEKNINQFGMEEGMSVADFGSGSGAYVMASARKVGSSGVVYAIDVQKDLLSRIKKSAKLENLSNIEIIWADIDEEYGSKLKEASVDVVIISNILFQLEKKENVAKEAKRVLKPGGRSIVIDWSESHGGLGPRPEDVITEKEARDMFENAGFIYEDNIDAGNYHYGMIFRS